MNRVTLALLAFALFLIPQQANASGIVYTGQDAAFHTGFPQAITLTQDIVRFAGGNSNPSILLVGSSSAGLLTSSGFSFTQIAPGSLSSTNLSAYQVVYFSVTTSQSDVNTFIAQSGQVQSYVNSGGGLVVEPEVFAAGSWSWVPGAALIGTSGSANVSHESVLLTGLGPNAGLTNLGLSNWFNSIHSEFSTPAAGGFTSLSTDGANGFGVTIFESTSSTIPIPEPSTFAIFGMMLALGAGCYFYRRQRMFAPVA